MLVDDVIITVKAGNGGRGSTSFLRSRHQPRGGPDGGNGGSGGSVYFRGTTDITALQQFQFKKKIFAENGLDGRGQKLFGRNGKDITVYVPVGTTITDLTYGDTWEVIDTKTQILVARGARGGRGNTEFKSATNQSPIYAENGKQTSIREIHLVLKFIADIGLIGLPNAGKSSLLEALTRAHPKIGDYPFTTLEPNLGVMAGLVLADIPGLIEGAHEGRGLGIKFLKHIEKTRLLIHCIDVTSKDLLSDYAVIRNELKRYDKMLAKKKEIILLTKIDLIEKEELDRKVDIFKKKSKKALGVSVIDDESLNKLAQMLQKI